jgi:hypothetical protein
MSRADSIIAYGMSEIGKPYVYGDEGPGAFDCSGLMQFIFAKAGIKLPRTAAEQQKVATPTSNPVPGDLVFYGYPAHHVALYLGGGRQLAAPHTGTNVKVQNVSSGAAYGRIAGAGTGTVASTVATVTTPVVASASGLIDSLADSGKLLMFTVGGAGAVLAGLWLAVKGKS